MSLNDVIVPTISFVIGGGLFTSIAVLWKGRSEAKNIDQASAAARAKLPGEVDSVAIQNAETALEMQKAVNATLVAELARKDVELTRKDAHIVSLETAIEGLRADLTNANEFGHKMIRELASANDRYAKLQREMATYRNTTPPQE